MGEASHVGDVAERFRAVRREIERSVLPLASSVDGVRFRFQASPYDLAFRVGGYVEIVDETSRLGQVLSLELVDRDGPSLGVRGGENALQTSVQVRIVEGEGVVLEGDGLPFHDASTRPASSAAVSRWAERTRPRRAALAVGELALAPGVPHFLDAGGFDRHTFFCGQSGSGKTYSLGLVLEQLLLETDLRIVVLDPNSDFVRMRQLRGGVDEHVARRYAQVAGGVVVRSSARAGSDRLRLRMSELAPALQAAVLRLDPIDDRHEYAALLDALESPHGPQALAELAASPREELRNLGLRARNLGVYDWSVWARDDPGTVLDELGEDGWRMLVVDLGSLATAEEQALTAASVLDALWQRRKDRRPVLVVIDEAHNVCPQSPPDPLTRIATEHAVRIAGEGRKFGLYLLVSTQRPQKVHENVLSQCDNLVLMRMNSTADLGFVGDVLSFVPRTLLARATGFGLGEALLAGKHSSHPALVRFGARVAEEGGSDVPSDWAAPR